MKFNYFITSLIMIGLGLYFYSYNYFLYYLSIVWFLTSTLIIYSGINFSIKYKFIQLRLKKIFISLKSKSKNEITPFNSLSLSLAAKIGVGSLSGVALAIYYGGVGTILWIIIVSLIVSINTYTECLLGIKYRIKINNSYFGGPGFYIKKCLNNKYLSYLYCILIIVCYSGLFLSIQSNTIISTTKYFNFNSNYIVLLLLLLVLIIIIKEVKGVIKINSRLVPIMLIFYLLLGLYVVMKNFKFLPKIIFNVIKEGLNIKTIIPVFLIGMQRGIFITESGLGTSSISASLVDNDSQYQGLLEVLGIYITIFLVCLITFIIIVTSNYTEFSFGNINGIELLIYAFKYHFGNMGVIFLSIITIMFAFSTIIASYYFGESNISFLFNRKNIKLIFKILFVLIVFISCYLKANILWNMTDFLIAILALINVYSMLKIIFYKKV